MKAFEEFSVVCPFKNQGFAKRSWLMPVILATWEALGGSQIQASSGK
jgi:hypothetical protein